jgi:translation initiation factor IF-3
MGQAEMEPKLMGKSIGMTISPLPANKRKRKFAPPTEELPPEPDDEADDDDDAEE